MDSRPDPAADFANGFPQYLYFLPSAATSGDLAGLVKVGITDNFAVRYRQHQATWGEFDLGRAALLRVAGRREVRQLEQALRYAFGSVDEEMAAEAAGKTLTNADFIALGSWRRYPGRRDQGHTEFFAIGCLQDMLAMVELWIRCRGERAASASLQRGLTLADCVRYVGADGSRPATKQERRTQEQQEREARHALIAQKVRWVLDLILAHEEHVVWVELARWDKVRAAPRPGMMMADGLADFYLGGFGPAPFANDTVQRPAALVRLEEEFTRIEVPTAAYLNLRQQQEQEVWRWQEPPHHLDDRVVPPCAEQALRLCLDPGDNAPALPFYDEFAALAKRVEARRRG